jgi:preprotein translocase subunit SecD
MQFPKNLCKFVYVAVAAATCFLGGCDTRNSPRTLSPAAALDVRLVSATNVANSQQATDPNSGATIYLIAPPVIASADVATLQRSEESPGLPSLTVNLTPAGGRKMAAATTPATGQELAVIVNGEVIWVAAVRSPVSNGFRISGGTVQKHREQIFEDLTKK